MKYLLDTCTFLWIILDSTELSAQAKDIFLNTENEIYLSSASTWEMVQKFRLGRLPFPQDPFTYIPKLRKQHGIEALSIDEDSILHLLRLPDIHRDPFDRILISQSIIHGMILVTPDTEICKYPGRTLW